MSNTIQPDLPATMYALQAHEFGPPSTSFQYLEIMVPEISRPTQVLVQVYAAGINPAEAKVRSGNISRFFKMPTILGADFSGVIVGKGTYAEYTVVDVEKDAISKKPNNLPFIEAGAVGIAALTAYEAIVNKGRLSQLPKDVTPNIVVIGASGGVGTYAVQIAKACGANVIGVCSKNNTSLVKSLGADETVDYTSDEEFNALLSRKDTFDLVVDCVGGDDYYNQFITTIKNSGVYISTVGPIQHAGSVGLGIQDIFAFGSAFLFRSMFSSRKYLMVATLPVKDFSEGLLPLFESESIKSVVLPENVYELKDGIKAHEAIESHRTVGKIVLKMNT
ncbi:hypothetical protein J3Q64DRAFT_1344657 [Phycomyces blakesleeanus]|uniref:Enoyl reductase (ER) domain-containing protein n=1 Tax=Phycomyces blakesleeanus TaxID=4837 RepID=A0ABR3B889_PHYBL